MWKVCRELSNRSGGGWDEELQRPIAPSQAEYVEMVKAKGAKAKFLLRNNFPWYHQIARMAGGQSARGDSINGTYMGGAQIQCLMNTQLSIHCSEQGSSDDADDGTNGDDYNTFVPPCDRGAGSSYPMHGQDSDASLPRSRTSGSKRKTTDESSDQSSRGKRLKNKYRKNQVDNECLTEAAFQIVKCLREDITKREKKEEEERKCMQKFKAIGIVDSYQDFCVSFFDSDFRRNWFLENDSEEIWRWVERNIVNSPFKPIPTPPNHVPNQGFGQPSFSQSSFMSRGPTF